MRGPRARIHNASAFESIQMKGGLDHPGNGTDRSAYGRTVYGIEDRPGIWYRVARTSQSLVPAENAILATGLDGGVIELRKLKAATDELLQSGFSCEEDEDGMVQGSLLEGSEEE